MLQTAADYLVNHGVPFRDAHGIIGQSRAVLALIKGFSIEEMTLDEFQAICPAFQSDIYDAIALKTCVNMRNTIGGPGEKAMARVIELNKKYLTENPILAKDQD